MFIKNEDLEFLIELEQFIFELGTDYQKATEENIAPYFHKLYELVEKMIAKRNTSNIKNTTRIYLKRQANKYYARSKKEIERIKKHEQR